MSEKYEQLTTDGKYRTVYGYDNPLETFYFQVFEIRQESSGNSTVTSLDDSRTAEVPVVEDDSAWEREIGLVLWLGTLTGEIPTVEALVEAAAPYVAIPEVTVEKLRADQQSAPGPTPFQRAIRI